MNTYANNNDKWSEYDCNYGDVTATFDTIKTTLLLQGTAVNYIAINDKSSKINEYDCWYDYC